MPFVESKRYGDERITQDGVFVDGSLEDWFRPRGVVTVPRRTRGSWVGGKVGVTG